MLLPDDATSKADRDGLGWFPRRHGLDSVMEKVRFQDLRSHNRCHHGNHNCHHNAVEVNRSSRGLRKE